MADTASGADPEKLTDDILDGFYRTTPRTARSCRNGLRHTGGVSLAAKALIIKVSGGLLADVDLHLDPTLDDAQQRVRLGSLADELGDGSDPFTASGSIFVAADLQIVIPGILWRHCAGRRPARTYYLGRFRQQRRSPQYNTNNTILIDKDSDSENISVKMEARGSRELRHRLAVHRLGGGRSEGLCRGHRRVVPRSQGVVPGRVLPAHQWQLVGEALEVQTSDPLFTTFSRLQRHPRPGWTPITTTWWLTTQPSIYSTTRSLKPETKTISVGYIVGDAHGTPVNAVLIGGSGNEFWKQGHGKAVLIGGGGDDKLRAFNQQAQQVDEFGDDIDPSVFNVNTINFAMPDDTRQRILAHVVTPSGTPAQTSNVLAGAFANVFLEGGSWDNFFEGGSVATFVGGADKTNSKSKPNSPTPTRRLFPATLSPIPRQIIP